MIFAGFFQPADTIRAAAVILLASLAGCAATPPQSLPCPQIITLKDVSYLTRFAGGSEDLTDTLFEAKVDSIHSKCVYVENEGKRMIRSTLVVQLLASRGPKNQDNSAKFQYFIAITGSGGQRLTRQDLDVEIPLTTDKPQNIFVDPEIELSIPVPQGQNGDFFRIYVGLNLTEKEVAFNRRNPH
jgi:hypothetical protein